MNEKEMSISLGDIGHAVWKNKCIAIFVTLLVTLLGIIYTLWIATPKYKSSTVVLASVNSTNSSSANEVDYSNSLKVVTTVSEIACESCVLDIVSSKHNDLTTSDLKKMVSSKVATNSYLITITVVSTNKEQVEVIANEVAEALIYVSKENEAVATLKPVISQTSPATKGQYSSPNRKLYILVSFVLGLVVSMVSIFLKEFMSNKFKKKEEVETDLNLRIIGTFGENKNADDDLLTIEDKSRLEEYNMLLSNIRYSKLGHPYKVITITSTGENELKTTTISNLAFSLSLNGYKVCVLDLDIKRPCQHKIFKIEREKGLVEYINGEIEYSELVRHTECGVDVIPAGIAVVNSMAVLEAPGLEELVKKLKSEYDYVLIDTSPLIVSFDAYTPCKLSDAVVFNVSLNQCKKKEAAEVVRNLKMINVPLIGCVVNKIPLSRNGYYYYNYKEPKKA